MNRERTKFDLGLIDSLTYSHPKMVSNIEQPEFIWQRYFLSPKELPDIITCKQVPESLLGSLPQEDPKGIEAAFQLKVRRADVKLVLHGTFKCNCEKFITEELVAKFIQNYFILEPTLEDLEFFLLHKNLYTVSNRLPTSSRRIIDPKSGKYVMTKEAEIKPITERITDRASINRVIQKLLGDIEAKRETIPVSSLLNTTALPDRLIGSLAQIIVKNESTREVTASKLLSRLETTSSEKFEEKLSLREEILNMSPGDENYREKLLLYTGVDILHEYQFNTVCRRMKLDKLCCRKSIIASSMLNINTKFDPELAWGKKGLPEVMGYVPPDESTIGLVGKVIMLRVKEAPVQERNPPNFFGIPYIEKRTYHTQ